MTTEEQNPGGPEDSGENEGGVDENRIVRERYEKAARYGGGDINKLYAHHYEPTCSVATARAEAEALIAAGKEDALGEKEYRLAARIIIVRSFGKAAFLMARDGSGTPSGKEGEEGKHSGQIQFYVKQGVVDEKGYDYYKNGLDAGDIVGVRGRLFLSNTRELSLKAEELVLLTKSVRPLPEKWHGLTNVDIRYRQRYVDLIVNPEVAETFKTRSKIIGFIRNYLNERGYMEVETPMMQTIYGGATAKPFVTHHNALDIDLYLRIAPELFLKRLIVGGFEKVYEINRNFRNEGLSTRHNPEFTMLELYTSWWDYSKTMDLAEDLIRKTARSIATKEKFLSFDSTSRLEDSFARVTILQSIADKLKVMPSCLKWGLSSVDELMNILESHDDGFRIYRTVSTVDMETPGLRNPKVTMVGGNLNAPNRDFYYKVTHLVISSDTADEALMKIFEFCIEPDLIRPTFALDFPKSLCPLAKSKADDPATAERFELFIGGMEIANAYSELNDPKEQLARFQEQVAAKKSGDEEAMNQVDADYVRALEYGMPPCSGLGIGIDRLAMLLTNSSSIRDVILFPTMRPE